MLDSALFLDPADKSDETRKKRLVEYRAFDGLVFLAMIGIEPGKDGFADKNIIARVITKEMPQWGGRPPIGQLDPYVSSAGAASAPIVKPSWAQ
jgi:hypothetical protein